MRPPTACLHHGASEGLRDAVEGRPFRPRSLAAEATVVGVDDLGVDLPHVFIAIAPALHNLRAAEVLAYHVRPLYQALLTQEAFWETVVELRVFAQATY